MKYYHRTRVIDKGKSNEWVVDCVYDIDDLPLNKPIWGFAYDINDDTEHRRLSCTPVRGEIVNSRHFIPYKKGTMEKRKSGRVELNSRMYADTYEEAAEMYNELVQQRINNLKRMIDEAEKEKIVLEE